MPKKVSALSLACFIGHTFVLLATPTGAEVVQGTAHVIQEGSHTTIHASDGSILQYQSFNVAPHESVQFVQPGPDARVLNRVLSPVPSEIDGRLQSNGIVYLVNPSGIIFGPHSVINVHQLFAAAAQMSNEDFLSGMNRFTNIQGSISNYGKLLAEAVHLVGKEVTNLGSIIAKEGTVSFVSGESVVMGEKEGHLFVKFARSDEHKPSEKKTFLGAGDVYALAISHRGSVQAKQIHVEADSDSKLEIGGSLVGETVHLLGDRVALQEATIDVSQEKGGGTVLVGGDYKGEGSVRNATYTSLDESSIIKANALSEGDGGKVILWANDATLFNGKIEAKGGPLGGDGGFVETSGKAHLGVYTGHVDTSSPQGAFGQWLLDPDSVTIQGTSSSLPTTCPLPSSSGTLVIGSTAIENASSSVQICANSEITQVDSITFKNPGVSVSYEVGSGGTINIENSLTVCGGGAITLEVGSGGTINIENPLVIKSGEGTITLDATSSGTVALSGFGTSSPTLQSDTGAITITGATVLGNNNTCLIQSNSGAITFNGTVDGSPAIGPNALHCTTASTIQITGAIGSSIELQNGLSLQGSGGVTISNIGTSLEAGAFDTITLDAGSKTITLTGTIYNNTLGQVFSSTVSLQPTSSPATVTFNSNNGNMSFQNIGGSPNNFILNAGSGTITLNGTSYSTGAQTYNGNVVLGANVVINTNGNALTFADNVTGTSYSLTATASPINLNGTSYNTRAQTYTGNVSLGGSPTLTTNNGALQINGNVSGGGSLTINSGSGSTEITGTTAVPTVSLQNTTGSVSFDGAVTLGTLTTAANGYSVAFGTGGTVTTNTTFYNTGGVTFGSASSSSITFTGGLTSTAGTTTILGAVGTTNTAMSLGAVTLEANSTLNAGTSTIGIGNVSAFDSSPFTLTATASGGITLNGTTYQAGAQTYNGAVTLTGDVTFNTEGEALTFADNVTGTSYSLNATASPINLNGTTYNTGAQTYTGNVSLGGSPALTTNNGALQINGNVSGGGSLTINSGSGSTEITGTTAVPTVSLQNTTGSVSFDGAVTLGTLTTAANGYSVAFGTGGTVTTNTTFNNTGGVTFGSASSSSITFTGGLTSTAGTTTILGAVDTTNTAMSLGAVTLEANTTLNAGTSTIGIGNVSGVFFGFPFTLSATASGGITLNGTTYQAGAQTYNGAVTLTGDATFNTEGGALTFSNNVTGPHSLTATASPINLNGTTYNTAAQTYNGDVVLGGSPTLITNNNPLLVNGDISGGGTLTIESGSASTEVVGTTTVPTVSLQNTTGAVSFEGDVTIGTLTTIANDYAIAFGDGGTVTTNTTFLNTGTVTFGNSDSSSLTFTGGVSTASGPSATHTFGALFTDDTAMTLKNLLLDGETSLFSSGGAITFPTTIDGDQSLSIDAGAGAANFVGVVGGSTPLKLLNVSAGGITLHANMYAQGGTLIYNSPVTLAANITLTDTGSTGIIFNSSIDGNFTLTLNATNGSITVSGPVGSTTPLSTITATSGAETAFFDSVNLSLSGAPGADFTIVAGDEAIVEGPLTTAGGANGGGNGFNGGNVSITSTGSSVIVQDINTSGSAPAVGFTGGSAGTISLQPASTYTADALGSGTFVPNGKLELLGDLTALGGGSGGSDGTISLSPAGRSVMMSIATITSSPSGNDVTIRGGTLNIGNLEAMTILGNITMALSSNATVGDIVSLDQINIAANPIRFNLHQPGEIIDFTGVLYANDQTHLIAYGITLSGAEQTTGSGPAPALELIDPTTTPQDELLLFLFYKNNILNFNQTTFINPSVQSITPVYPPQAPEQEWDLYPTYPDVESRPQLAEKIEQQLSNFDPAIAKTWYEIKEEMQTQDVVQTAFDEYTKAQGQEVNPAGFAFYIGERKDADTFVTNLLQYLKTIQQQPVNEKDRLLLEVEVEMYTKPIGLTLYQWNQVLIQLGL